MDKRKVAIAKYGLITVLVPVALMVVKALLSWIANQHLYALPVVGGWLQSLEVMELSNVIVFALLGVALGAATVYCPNLTWRWLPLVIAMPLVFLSSYWMRYHLWLNQVAHTSALPGPEAVEIAHQTLEAEAGQGGFFGYFSLTTQVPVLPTTAAELQTITSDQQWFRSELTRFSGIEPGIFSLVFAGVGWGIRLFHLILALLTGIIYFNKGLLWADRSRLRRLAVKRP